MTQQAPATQPAPPMVDHNMLVGALATKVRATLPNGPTPPSTTAASVLEWLATQSADTIKKAITETQPHGYKVAVEPLVQSLTDDQARGVLVALMAVFVQTL